MLDRLRLAGLVVDLSRMPEPLPLTLCLDSSATVAVPLHLRARLHSQAAVI